MHTVLVDAQLQLIQDDLHRFSEGNGFWSFDNTSFFQEWFLKGNVAKENPSIFETETEPTN